MNNYLILLAGGSGTRLNFNKSKALVELSENVSLLEYNLRNISSLLEFKEIIVVARKEDFNEIEKISKQISDKIHLTTGGKRRQDSVLKGIKKLLSENSIDDKDICFINNVANPFVNKEELSNLRDECSQNGAATLGTKSINTIRQVDKNNLGIKIIDREFLWEIQTPQALKFDIIKKSLDILESENHITDDVSMAEYLNINPYIVETTKYNFKITTEFDLAFARYLIENNIV